MMDLVIDKIDFEYEYYFMDMMKCTKYFCKEQGNRTKKINCNIS